MGTVRAFVFILSLMLAGCIQLPVKLADFMVADRGAHTAKLSSGYQLDSHVAHSGKQRIGISYAHHPASRALILYCGGDVFHRAMEGAIPLEALTPYGDVVLFDYPGYGNSSGPATVSTILEAAITVYDYIHKLPGSAGKKRLLYGFSLGGLVAAQLARERPADGLILEATSPSVEQWAHSQIPLLLKPWVRVSLEAQLQSIDSVEALSQFNAPILILTSHTDRRVKAALSINLAKQLQAAQRRVTLTVLENKPHGSILQSTEFKPHFARHLQRVGIY
jgi:uncharacterized protein